MQEETVKLFKICQLNEVSGILMKLLLLFNGDLCCHGCTSQDQFLPIKLLGTVQKK